MKNLSQSFTLGLLIMGLTSLSACSSSQVEEGAAPVETASDATLDDVAATDAVPGTTPEALAATPPADDMGVIPSADPSLDAPVDGAVADATVPGADVPVVDAPVTDTPVADAPITETAVADAPITETTIAEAAPVVEEPAVKASKGDGTGYRVKKGDTLMKIAFEQYGDLYRWKEIYEANRGNIQDPNHVPPGTELTLNGAGMVTIERNGESYLIKRGDTLGVISNDVYGTTRKWKKLWENNRQLIKDPNKIYAGFYLYYQPESKLTHDDVAPGLKKEDSAMNAPVVGAAPREPASATTVTEPSVKQ